MFYIRNLKKIGLMSNWALSFCHSSLLMLIFRCSCSLCIWIFLSLYRIWTWIFRKCQNYARLWIFHLIKSEISKWYGNSSSIASVSLRFSQCLLNLWHFSNANFNVFLLDHCEYISASEKNLFFPFLTSRCLSDSFSEIGVRCSVFEPITCNFISQFQSIR